jgi:hypothetical protein
MPIQIMDAPAALGFVLSQRTALESEVLSKPYPEFKYARMIPIDTSANPYAASVTFFLRDSVGKAKFINASGDDIPYANTTMTKFEQTVMTAGIGAQWSLEEIGAAAQLGMSLATDELDAARQSYERLVEEVAFVGDASISVEGLFNTTGITTTAAGVAWASATSAQIVQQIVDDFTAVRTSTLGIETADTLVLPIAQHALIATKAYGVEGGLTILQYLQNALTALMGKPIMVESDYRLTARAVVYKRAPDAMKMHIPMPLQFVPPQMFNFKVKTLGMFRFSALNIRKPASMRYRTGI